LPAVGKVGGEILFGFSFRPLWTRDRLVATGVSGAMQQGVRWGFILIYGWTCVVPFCVIEFGNLKSNLLLVIGRAKWSVNPVSSGFLIVFGLFAPAVESKGPPRCNGM
jgi:hypothetical protein